MSLLRDPSVGSMYEKPDLCMEILGIDVILDDEVNMLSLLITYLSCGSGCSLSSGVGCRDEAG